MIRLLVIISALLLALPTFGQNSTNKNGHPFINIYRPHTFYNTVQYLSAAQDARGVLYFANKSGIAEYDGHEWREIRIGHSYGGSEFLAADPHGVIYVGSYNDFGYLAPDKNGNIGFRSLRSLLPRSVKIPSINNPILFDGDIVYFCSDTTIFAYNKEEERVYVVTSNGGRTPCIVGNQLLIGTNNQGLCEVDTIKRTVINADIKGQLFDAQKINKDEYLLSIADNPQIYNTRTGQFRSVDFDGLMTKIKEQHGQLTNIEPLAGGNTFAISTSTSVDDFAFAVIDKDCHVVEVVNEKQGLNSNFIYHQKYTNDGQLWLTNFNITRVEIESPLRCFDSNDGINGTVMSVVEYKGNIYIGTTDGLYKLKRNGNPSAERIDIKGTTIYSLTKIINPYNNEECLLVGSDLAVSIIINDNIKKLIDLQTSVIYQSRRNPKYIYINGAYNLERYILTPEISLQLDKVRELKKVPSQIYNAPCEDLEGNLWFNIYGTGIGRFDVTNQTISTFNYGSDFASDVYIFNVDNKLIFSSKRGLYEFDNAAQTFVPSNILQEYGNGHGRTITSIVNYGNGYLVMDSNDSGEPNGPKFLVRNEEGRLQLYATPFKRIKDESVKATFIDRDSVIWMAGEKGVYTYKTDANFRKLMDDTRLCSRPFNVLVRRVEANDSVIFNGCFVDEEGIPTGRQQNTFTIPYSHNDISFTCAATFYECEEFTTYSYCLEGLNDKFSDWTNRATINYINLSDGTYTFKVKARNIYGIESNVARFSFTIATPFYSTTFAKIIYIILILIFISIILKISTRSLKRHSLELEHLVAQRTMEISEQKEELKAQRDEIEKREHEMISSLNYARYIQMAALPPQSRVNEIFPENFIFYRPRDIVSGDFYWVAEIGDKKICAVADCTGHGVPGGFLSMLGMSFLRQIVAEEQRPDKILNQLRADIIQNLHQVSDENGSKDGMDMAVFVIDKRTNHLDFAGANMPLVVVRDKKLISLQNDKMPVGLYVLVDELRDFSIHGTDLYRGDMIYVFSDGFADQFGGAQKRKFMRKPLYGLFQQISEKPMLEQRQILERTFKEFRGNIEQTDDVTVLGIRI